MEQTALNLMWDEPKTFLLAAAPHKTVTGVYARILA